MKSIREVKSEDKGIKLVHLRDGFLDLVRLLIVGLNDLSSSQGHDDLL